MPSPLRKNKLLSREKLEKLTTKRLLAYKNSLMRVVEGHLVDIYGDTHPADIYVSKQSPEWQETMKVIKEILGTREHIPR